MMFPLILHHVQRRPSDWCLVSYLQNWNCHALDIKYTFLQGHANDKEVFILPPDEFYNGCVWKLRKTIYGLNDAAKAWHERIKQELVRLGTSMCDLEPALFFWYSNGNLKGIICIHVDDIYWSGSDAFKEKVMPKIE